MEGDFQPALIIVDLQEDFCPPNGSLAVEGGRDIALAINSLLHLPFTLKVATKDFHPANHISFASNHPPPDNKPFDSFALIKNPHNPDETFNTRLWPDHCVQGTPGAELISELEVEKVDHIIKKGQDSRVEMYSAFTDPFENPSVTTSRLAEILHGKKITHAYVVGLAMDYCVKHTAVDAKKEGFEVYIIEEATKAVDDGPNGWGATEDFLSKTGIPLIKVDGREVSRVKSMH